MTIKFKDTGTFAENLALFDEHLRSLDQDLAYDFLVDVQAHADGRLDREAVLDHLMTAIKTAEAAKEAKAEQAAAAGAESGASEAGANEVSQTPPFTAPTKATVGWLLEQLDIEGFRGINNENAPLILKFKTSAVSSISAPNGVGKSSIFDALTYALRKSIPKLDDLHAAEKGRDYYLNRFHSGGVGTVILKVKPTDGSASIAITVKLDATGKRTVSATNGVDGEALLEELYREFVLLDGQTFQRFISETSLNRGRNFAGLLGLAQYAAMRRTLDMLSNTRAFNNHFDRTAVDARKKAASRSIADVSARIGADYEILIKEPLEPATERSDAQARCHSALSGIQVLAKHCDGQTFAQVDLDACLSTIIEEEGGETKKRHGELTQTISNLEEAEKKGASEAEVEELAAIAARRDAAVALTAGDLLNEVYRASEKVLVQAAWPSSRCPTCDRDDGSSVLDLVHAKIAEYEKVDEETTAGVAAWTAGSWAEVSALGKAHLPVADVEALKPLLARGAKGELTAADATTLATHLATIRTQIATSLAEARTARDTLAGTLPPSMAAATNAINVSRRLQTHWSDVANHEEAHARESAIEDRIARIKTFVDGANTAFAGAESAMANERLQKVLPVCRNLFKAIMGQSVVPGLAKRTGTEEIAISLTEFWSLKDVSAQALLSESFRNGFAVSVYLAAASLYGGAPKFMILDDVTSSLDAGHQLNLIDVIRLQFARPEVADGPQIIILSHDTMLEKLFNTNGNSAGWQHQRLEGTPQLAVLPQTGAINKVRDGTKDLLNQGRATDAAPFIRQYLEYQLSFIISKCRIPVPIDIAYSDEQKMVGKLLKAVQDAVALHKKAGDLVLEPAQETALDQRVTSITSNFVSHWATGSSGAYSAAALQTVLAAIETLEDSFQYEPTPGAAKVWYFSLSKR
ncbi:AAA family ATPase [Vitreimonas flagellata]|uniref:AAA family ATPase n=1 Tax=Vitreimonas flagellata TaxID=2560861 RepID=UPI001074A964|nr:AAA family ATPase [Vitreimonas flagellata]